MKQSSPLHNSSVIKTSRITSIPDIPYFTDQADGPQISVSFSPIEKPHVLTWVAALSPDKKQGYRLSYQALRIWELDGWADTMIPGLWDVSNDLRVKDHQYRASEHADKTNEFNQGWLICRDLLHAEAGF